MKDGINALTEDMNYNSVIDGYSSINRDDFRIFMGVKNNLAAQPHEVLMREADDK